MGAGCRCAGSGTLTSTGTRAPSQYPKRRLFVRSRKVLKPWDWYFKLSYRFVIWQAHRQHCCRSTCQISERSDNSKYKSRSFETLRDLMKSRLFGYWDGGPVGPVLFRLYQLKNSNTVWCRHNAFNFFSQISTTVIMRSNFLQNSHDRHPMGHSSPIRARYGVSKNLDHR